MMTVQQILDDVIDMECILDRIKVNEDNPSYYEIRCNDMVRLRELFRNYKRMLCSLEIKENRE